VAAMRRTEGRGTRWVLGSHFDYQSAVGAIWGIECQRGIWGRVEGGSVWEGVRVEYTPLKTTMRDTMQGLLEAERRCRGEECGRRGGRRETAEFFGLKRGGKSCDFLNLKRGDGNESRP
jgi:hypothetical protein